MLIIRHLWDRPRVRQDVFDCVRLIPRLYRKTSSRSKACLEFRDYILDTAQRSWDRRVRGYTDGFKKSLFGLRVP